jgi:hypothetical protein
MISLTAGSFGPTEFGWQKYVLDENVSGTYNTRLLPITVSLERSRMPEIVVESPAPSCCLLLSESEIGVSQRLGPDPFLPRAREARGRFANGSSGNPRGRPRGIRNPRRRIPDLVARPLSDRRCRGCSTASRICCAPSLDSSCRRRLLRSIRPGVSGSTCRHCARRGLPAGHGHRSDGNCARPDRAL